MLTPGKNANLADGLNYWGTMVIPEICGCGGESFAANGTMVFRTSTVCTCNRGMAFTQIGMMSGDDDNEENWINYSLSQSTHQFQETPVRRVAVNFGAPGDRYVEADKMLWTHHPGFGQTGELTPLLEVTYRGNATNVYHSSAPISTGTAPHGWVSASYMKGMDGLTIPLAMPVVAKRTATAPVIDGNLNDACWDGSNQVNIPVFPINYPPHACSDNCYVMLRYDDTNLYIAGGMHAVAQPGYAYLKIALNSREQRIPAVILLCGDTGKASQGIDTNAWQVACATSTTNQEVFRAEIAIPWSALEAAGLWKEHLVMNVEICGTVLDGTTEAWTGYYTHTFGLNGTDMASYLSPVYLDAARGPITETSPHTVRLYFAEMESQSTGQRRFNVSLQGQKVLTNFDVVATAGGPRRETIQEFRNISIADKLDIDFTRLAGEPMLSGVEIIDTQTNQSGAHIDPANVPPVALLDASVVSGQAPLAVTFNARRSYDPDGQIVECVVETGDGRLARGSLIHHVFAEPGTYKVNLLVLDNRGATAATNVTVTVNSGAASAFVCAIRASGGDYANLSTWNSAIQSDLTSSSTIFQVSSPGTYVSSDNGSIVYFSGGATGVLRWVATSLNPMIAAIADVGGTGTVTSGTVTLSSGNTFTISDTGVPARSSLFNVSVLNNYSSSADDGTVVTFSGGGSGILKHINGNNLAYIAECRGTIQAAAVTCASGHQFTIGNTGTPIVTAVAECYNDWSNGLNDYVKLAGWITDENHCVTIRPAAGQGHTGKLKGGDGHYTGFTLKSDLDCGAIANTRVERIADDGSWLVIGAGGSVNRVLSSVAMGSANYGRFYSVTVANSIGDSFYTYKPCVWASWMNDASLYNCTANSYQLGSSFGYQVRAINCLSMANATGYSSGTDAGYDPTREYWLSHSISADGTATNFDAWKEGNEGNRANQAVSVIDAVNGDYHLADADSGARGLGVPGIGADIDGQERLGPAYDVGADQTSGGLSAFELWQIAHFGSTSAQGAGATDDPDCDGMNNTQEWIAGTDPTNANSRLVFSGLRKSSANVDLDFDTILGRSYSVYFCTGLVGGANWHMYTNFQGIGDPAHVTFTNALPRCFFRIGVK